MRKELGIVLLIALPACGDAEPAAVASCPVPAARSMNVEPFAYTALEATFSSNCALGNDGSVACWDSDDGRPSRHPDVAQATAFDIDSIGGWAAREGGSVVHWQDQGETVVVPGVCGATAVTENRCAIVAEGRVRCWNVRGSARLGASESDLASGRAITVPGLRGAVSLASGPHDYTCALLDDATVTCWGGGTRLADRPSPEPAPVPELSGVRSIMGSPTPMLTAESAEICAVLMEGTVTCWNRARAPAPLSGLADVTSLSISMDHGCAALGDGSAVCWGANQTGQLGNGTTDANDTPVPVSGLSGVVQVATASLDSTIGHSCALLVDGTATCWGAGQLGSLRDGNLADSSVPVPVSFP